MSNQFTGHQAPGYRFCFHVSSIAHCPHFLPTEMKTLPEIQHLLKGESPLSVRKPINAFPDQLHLRGGKHGDFRGSSRPGSN